MATANVQVDRQNGRYAAHAGIATRENAPVSRAIADGDDPLRRRRRRVGALERLAHVRGNRSGHEQHIGMPRRGDEAHAEALQIVHDIVESMNLAFATVARTRVNFANEERPTHAPPSPPLPLPLPPAPPS